MRCKQVAIAAICVVNAFLLGLLAGFLIGIPGNAEADLRVLVSVLVMLFALTSLASLVMGVDLGEVRQFRLRLPTLASRLFNAALFREASRRASLGEHLAEQSRRESSRQRVVSGIRMLRDKELALRAAREQREYQREREYDDVY